jgi:uncharacterized protein (TIGR03067 family)
MKTILSTISLGLFALLCTAMFAAEPVTENKVGRDQPLTAAMLAGTYTIESSQKGDEKTPADKLDGTVVTFSENTIVAVDRDKNELYAATFKLENSQTPAKIKMISTNPEHKGAEANGLIHRDGALVKLIYVMPDEGDMPSKFEPGKGQRMLTLKKIQETASVPTTKSNK